MRRARQVGRYVVGERLGRGGLADVHLAHVEGASGFRKQLVLKQVRGDLLARPEVSGLLLAEAQIVQRLSHGNIVHVFDFGVDAGSPYLVMEYVDGVTLATLIHEARRGEPLDLAATLIIIEGMTSALDYAHTAVDNDDRALGLVHRDVTPANVLVSREGLVKLTDFGIAHLGAAENLGAAATLGAATARGTPGYMAPEQAAGAAVDRRADIFAVGVVLRELVAVMTCDDEVRAALLEIAAAAATPDPAQRIPDARTLAAKLERLRAASEAPRGAGELAERVRQIQRARRRVARDVEAALADRERPDGTQVLGARASVVPRPWIVAAGLLLLGGVIVAGASLTRDDRDAVDEATVVTAAPEPGHAPIVALVAAADVVTNTPATSELAPGVTPRDPRPAETEPVRRPISRRRPAEPATRDPPLEPGRLRVNVIPWAEVRLGDVALGRTPIDLPVAAGRHTVELTNPDSGQRRARTIDVAAGGAVTITEW